MAYPSASARCCSNYQERLNLQTRERCIIRHGDQHAHIMNVAGPDNRSDVARFLWRFLALREIYPHLWKLNTSSKFSIALDEGKDRVGTSLQVTLNPRQLLAHQIDKRKNLKKGF